jgi:hypothetical protein
MVALQDSPEQLKEVRVVSVLVTVKLSLVSTKTMVAALPHHGAASHAASTQKVAGSFIMVSDASRSVGQAPVLNGCGDFWGCF